ncbi:MAG: peptidase M48 [Bacteroidetes bacterium QH_2_64_74]|nr:MAG: peptidase M48 [Bacteroidetes bacterium QH_2_64_74]
MRNFFERQDEARRNTTKLIGLFGLAVTGIVVGVYLAVVLFLSWRGGTVNLVQPGLALVVLLGTLVLVGGGSAVKILSLRDGGHVVAESLGGEKLGHDPDSLAERQLLNVVEEMAIASGVPVPPVYVLEEEGINAFAAGFTPDDAVLGVTQGCIELLDRNELQGVIAHEFSHILNEDMRINIRLIGVLHGILLVGITGRYLMYSLHVGGRSRSGRSRTALFVLGLALVVIGFAGLFCGRLIKAAVSRQREFLADASAVQFTRNPEGIAGALKKIGGYESGSTVTADRAEEASHLFFGNALGEGFFSSGWLSTHPPLPKRIERIDPSFDRKFPTVATEEDGGAAPDEGRRPEATTAMSSFREEASEKRRGPSEAASVPDASVPDPQELLNQAGTVTADQIAYGGQLRADVPESLYRAVHEPLGAVAVAYGLLLDDEASMRTRQLRMLGHRETQAVAQETERLSPQVAEVPSRIRLPLLDLAAPALRDLSDEQRSRLHDTIRALAEADDQLTLFEYALATIVRHRLEHMAHPSEDRVQVKRFETVKEHMRVLLSALASVGHREGEAAQRAFQAGADALGTNYDVTGLEPSSVSAEALDAALDRLAVAAPSLKEDVVAACARCALADDDVTDTELTLLRAAIIALDVPLPPQLESVASGESAP